MEIYTEISDVISKSKYQEKNIKDLVGIFDTFISVKLDIWMTRAVKININAIQYIK